MAKNKKLPELLDRIPRTLGLSAKVRALSPGSNPPDHWIYDLNGRDHNSARTSIQSAGRASGLLVSCRLTEDRKQIVVLLREDAERLDI